MSRQYITYDNKDEVKDLLSFFEEYTDLKWVAGQHPLEYMPGNPNGHISIDSYCLRTGSRRKGPTVKTVLDEPFKYLEEYIRQDKKHLVKTGCGLNGEAVHCKTQEQWNAVLDLIYFDKHTTSSKEEWQQYFERYKGNCLEVGTASLHYSPVEYYIDEGYEIVEARDWLEKQFERKTKDKLQTIADKRDIDVDRDRDLKTEMINKILDNLSNNNSMNCASSDDRGIIERMSTALKKMLDSNKREQCKAGFRDKGLHLTEEGKEVLWDIAAEKFDEEFTERAKEKNKKDKQE